MYRELGSLLLASRMKRLGDRLLSEIARAYRGLNIGFEPSWFPVFYLLDRDEVHSVSSLAREMGVTDSAVSQLIRQLKEREFIKMTTQKIDKRTGNIQLSESGTDLLNQVKPVWQAIESTLEENLISGHYGPSLLYALAELEDFIDKNDLAQRINDQVNVLLYDQRYKIITGIESHRSWVLDFLFSFTIKPHPSWPEPTDVFNSQMESVSGSYQYHLLLEVNQPVALLLTSTQVDDKQTDAIHFCASNIEPASKIETYFIEKFSNMNRHRKSLSAYKADRNFLFRLKKMGYRVNPEQKGTPDGQINVVFDPYVSETRKE